jgi:hypothetical protein
MTNIRSRARYFRFAVLEPTLRRARRQLPPALLDLRVTAASLPGDIGFWTRIYVQDARSGVLQSYLVHQFWDKASEQVGGFASWVALLDNWTHDRWIESGRAWERRILESNPQRDFDGFFLREGAPRTQIEKQLASMKVDTAAFLEALDRSQASLERDAEERNDG